MLSQPFMGEKGAIFIGLFRILLLPEHIRGRESFYKIHELHQTFANQLQGLGVDYEAPCSDTRDDSELFLRMSGRGSDAP